MKAGTYLADVQYVGNYVDGCAPAWLDHVALLGGFGSGAAAGDFSWCDLGCGIGATANVLAALYPRGQFHGIDLLAGHIDSARRFAADAGLANAHFHHCDFAAAQDLRLPQFDYIVAHGVYTWIDRAAQQDLLNFIDARLKPGGLVYLSYNAMPGRAADVPLQKLVQLLARSETGNSARGLRGAAASLRALARAQAPALRSTSLLPLLGERSVKQRQAYLVHEFLTGHWAPLFVSDVRADLRGIGLEPAGSAKLIENYDSLVLGKTGIAALAGIGDADARELARDFLINQHFRCDVYVRSGRPLDDAARSRLLLSSSFTLAGPAAKIGFAAATAAGTVRFDNSTARHIVGRLGQGPRRLGDLKAKSIAEADLIANALVLCATGAILPVPGGPVPVGAVNRALRRRLKSAEEIRVLALPCGAAIHAEPGLLRRIDTRASLDGYPGWSEYLRIQGFAAP